MALELKANAADLADCEVQAIRLGGGSASIINGSDLDVYKRQLHTGCNAGGVGPKALFHVVGAQHDDEQVDDFMALEQGIGHAQTVSYTHLENLPCIPKAAPDRFSYFHYSMI